jgi:hypothetical protein
MILSERRIVNRRKIKFHAEDEAEGMERKTIF